MFSRYFGIGGLCAVIACSTSQQVVPSVDGGTARDTGLPDGRDAFVALDVPAEAMVPDAPDEDVVLPEDEEGGGGAEFLADEVFGAGDPGDWRPPDTVVLNCGWRSQVPPGSWSRTKNCGPVSLIMARNCLQNVLPTDTVTLIEWMEDNIAGYLAGAPSYNGSYTNTGQLVTVAERYFALSADRVTNMTLASLYAEIREGRPVIVAVDTQGGNNAPSRTMVNGDGHFMVIVGMTPIDVIVNDPGRSQECNADHRRYSIDSFYRIWSKHGRAAVTFGPGERNVVCAPGEACGTCSTTCGDRRCLGGEDCVNCPADCGVCSCECSDADGDGFRAGCDNPICGPQNDCDDTRADVNLGAIENCDNRLDDDCDGEIDCRDANCLDRPPCGCSSHADCPMGVCCEFASNSCGALPIDRCGNCELTMTESCNGRDDDCDGTVDEEAMCPAAQGCVLEMCRPTPSECSIVEFNGHAYGICDRSRYWQDAQDYCGAFDAHLVTINSRDEHVWLRSAIAEMGLWRVWIGLTRSIETCEWRWSTGDPVVFTAWAPRNPDGACAEAADCVGGELCAQYNRGDEWLWVDWWCPCGASFICEWDR